MSDLLAPFQFGFMQNAFFAALLLAPPTAILSCFLVLKGWSLMGDAISHATLPGLVLAYAMGLPLGLGAFASGMFCAVAIGYLQENSRIKRDTVMGIVFSGLFGLGLVMFTQFETDLHLDHILFGNILGIDAADLWGIAAIACVVLAVLAVIWRDLLLHAFDAAHARALGLRVGVLHYGFLALLSLTIVGTLQAVGLILAIGLLIAPGAIAFLLVRRFAAMMAIAVAVTLFAMLGGVYLSFWFDSAPAPTIILVLSVLFVLAFFRTSLRRSAV
jgi:manganese/iron transport system permease protein